MFSLGVALRVSERRVKPFLTYCIPQLHVDRAYILVQKLKLFDVRNLRELVKLLGSHLNVLLHKGSLT